MHMLNEEIAKQANIGFSKNEIIDNLKAKGYAKNEVDAAIAQFNFGTAATSNSTGGGISIKSILLGILFVVVMILRLGSVANTGSVFAIFGIFTAAGMAIYFFTKKK